MRPRDLEGRLVFLGNGIVLLEEANGALSGPTVRAEEEREDGACKTLVTAHHTSGEN